MNWLKQNWIIVGAGALVLSAVFFINKWDNLSPTTASIAEIASPIASYIPTETPEPLCDNESEVETFKEPVPIVWTAKLTGCLVSCFGAHFTRLPEGAGYKYPRFAGYYPDLSGRYDWDGGGLQIPDKFLKDGITLKVYGNWTSIDADHPNTVFEGKCVPIVEINKIEIVR